MCAEPLATVSQAGCLMLKRGAVSFQVCGILGCATTRDLSLQRWLICLRSLKRTCCFSTADSGACFRCTNECRAGGVAVCRGDIIAAVARFWNMHPFRRDMKNKSQIETNLLYQTVQIQEICLSAGGFTD